MPEIASITTAITAVKTAIDISKTIGNVDHTLEKSELKLKIIELRESLFNAKNELLNIKEVIQEKDEEIKRLTSLLEAKLSLDDGDIPDDCIKILELMSKVSNAETSQQIAHFLEIPEQRAKYFLDILVKKNLLQTSFSMRGGTFYSLNDKGRKLLFEKGLL